MNYKKTYIPLRLRQRGQVRKLQRKIKAIEPFVDIDAEYERFLVPSSPFIQAPTTSDEIKTEFCRMWLDKTTEIIAEKPRDLPYCKVVAMINVPNFWNSQIIIFYNEEYYSSFWNRSGPYQVWSPIASDASLKMERNIKTDLLEKGYAETISDEDESSGCLLWFYGDI